MKSFDWFKANAQSFHGDLRFGELLSRHTYYRIGGPAALMAFPRDESDLRWLQEGVEETALALFILGLGSNLLVSDEGFPGVVLKTSRLDISIEAAPDTDFADGLIVRTGSSVAISSLLRRASQEGWSGFECLAGVPGSTGGSIVMNAGTHLGEAQERVHRIGTYLMSSKEHRTWTRDQMTFEYRRNLFLPADAVVTWVEWRVQKKDPAVVRRCIDETLERRKLTQPVDFPSCGSVFKNPQNAELRAWQVVDKLGLRGHRVGNAQFAEKHSNFIVNLGNASASDVRALINLAQSRAKTELGITLEEEVKFLGKF